jgi:hypothetical protein
MEPIKFNNIEYYLAKDVYDAEPERFPNCSKTVRSIVLVKKLKDNEYIYLKEDSNKKLVESKSTYPRAKLYITKKWVHANLLQFKKVKTEEDKKLESMKAPSLLKLDDGEKFHDSEGNIIEIEIRGKRNIDEIYFKVVDIENGFGLKDISTMVTNKNSGFDINSDYKTFIGNSTINYGNDTSKKLGKNEKRMYLTYLGLTRLLFVSRSKNAEYFQKWAVQKLFTIQMGNPEEKKLLVDKLLGVPYKIAKETLKTNISPISCVYLFTLGTVEQLRDTFKIPEEYLNNWIVIKYGKTNNLERRTDEHNITFSGFNGIELRLKHYAFVDSNCINQAENDISEYIKNLKYEYQFGTFEELAIIPKDNMKSLTKKYEDIRKIYAGTMGELIRDRENLMHQVEIRDSKIEKLTMEKEMIELLRDEKLKNKDLEIKNYELQIKLLKMGENK